MGRWDDGTMGEWDDERMGRWENGTTGKWDSGTMRKENPIVPLSYCLIVQLNQQGKRQNILIARGKKNV